MKKGDSDRQRGRKLIQVLKTTFVVDPDSKKMSIGEKPDRCQSRTSNFCKR